MSSGLTPPTSPTSAEPPADGGLHGSCHFCGYTLYAVAPQGFCPECGTAYTAESITRLKPWPSAATVCLRLGWPILGLIVCIAIAFTTGNTPSGPGQIAAIIFAGVGWLFLIALPVNTWICVRRMLKRSMPEVRRTRGAVAVFRGLGTTVCVLAFLFLAIPFLLAGACLVAIATNGVRF